jgi:lysozyme
VGNDLGLGGFAPQVLEEIKSAPRDILLLGASEPEVLAFICEFEGYLKRLNDGTDRVKPYLCPAGYPTIGYGSIWRLDGTRVAMSDPPITKAEATQLFMQELSLKCAPAVSRLVTARLHELSRGALISFSFNCGDGALKGSNLRKAVNEQRWKDVPAEFAKWRMGGGRVLSGLVRRRKDEADMFMRGVAARRTGGAENDNGWIATVVKAA